MGVGNGWTDGLCLENGNECNELDYVFICCALGISLFCRVMMEMEKKTHLLFFLVSLLVKENNSLSLSLSPPLSLSKINSAPLDTYAASHSILLYALDRFLLQTVRFPLSKLSQLHSILHLSSVSYMFCERTHQRLGFHRSRTFTVRGYIPHASVVGSAVW